MSRLKLFLLGPPRLERDGEPLKLGPRKNIALLTYLAVTGECHSREALITLLWPELDPSRARAGLRRNLSILKKTLGGEWLLVDRETIGLDRNADAWIDVDQFHQLRQAWQTHDHPETDLCADCLTTLAEAVELYRGDFLAGFTLRDSPNFDEWQFFQAESLRQELATALERLVRGHSDRGGYEAAIPYARRWLALDPLHEPVHRHLMQLYAHTGQQAAALRQYQLCEQTLADELGIPPAAETTSLYEQICSRPAEQAEPLFSARRPPSSSVPPHNLPTSLTPFVGRETELAGIKACIQDPACRLLTLVGPGGIGKTHLALEAATTQLGHFAHGVYFVSLAPLQTVEAIVPTVAKALDFSFYEKENPRQQLLDYLRQKNMLLIMDNFEHLLTPPSVPPSGGDERGGPPELDRKGGAQLVVEMLRAVPGLKILTTSRARLNVKGEHLFPIEGMDFPDEETIEDVAQYSAIQLFLQSARRIQPGFELTAGNLTDVVQVCRLVEGMPLAILLAAAWVEMLTPAEITAEINQSIDFLATDWCDVSERQRSLRAVFDHSWHLLTEREQKVFQGLSVFRGGFTREAAQEVTGASLRTLMGLVNKSLLQRTSAGRYGMHELLRQYAAEKLETAGEANTIRDAHSVYYAEFLHQRLVDLKGQRQLGAMDEIDADFENTRVAWTRALERKNYSAIRQLLRSLGWYCTYRSRNQELEELLHQAQEQLTLDPRDEPHPIWARISVAKFYTNPNSVDRGQIEMSLTIAQKYGDREMMGYSLRTLGEVAFNVDDYAEALTFYETSLTHFRAMDDSFNIAATLYKLAQTYRFLGQPDQAIKFARLSLNLSREIGDKYWAAQSLANTGVIALYTGNYEEAEGHLQEANTIYREMGYKEGIAESNLVLGKLAFLRGDFAGTKTLAEEALELATDIGNKPIAQSAYSLRFSVASALGEKTDEHPDEKKLAHTTDIPTTIDRFEVKELIGTGGMGSVYLAHDPDNGRDVVLKMTNPEIFTKFDFAKSRMLTREAEVMVKLAQHPAFPACYGYGETADTVYIALEYIAGKDLEIILGEQKELLPEKVVIEWALQICDALMYVHNQEPEPIIFRDIKLGNVMIDNNDKVRLIDLGIAEAYRPGRELPLLGTEGYSPPEQYIGYSDARSDIYALGATLHHLLTRRDPRKETPFSFHDASPRSLNPAISEALEAVILKATEYQAEDRYQSAAEMKMALSLVLSQEIQT